MVPEGWKDCRLGEILTFQRGFDLPSKDRIKGRYPIYSSGGVSGFHNECKAKAPGVVTGRYGSVGDVFFVNEDYWPLNTSLWVKDFHSNDPLWIYYFLCRIDYKKYSDKTGVPGVNRNDLHAIKSVLPPLPEQKKIAKILSTWDRAIATTEKLLSNSQQQKKALMQQLLTGKTRFPGFTDEWKEVRLGDVCDPKQWTTISSKQLAKSGYPVFGANGLIGYYHEYNHKNETVAVSCRGANCGVVNLVPAESYITGNSLALDSIDENTVVCRFLFYSLIKRGFRDMVSGSAQPQIIGSDIRKAKTFIPSLSEQQKIASALSSSDKEIESLRQKLSHLKQEKKALMQQLLTGKRRVKV